MAFQGHLRDFLQIFTLTTSYWVKNCVWGRMHGPSNFCWAAGDGHFGKLSYSRTDFGEDTKPACATLELQMSRE
ncbi:hypothetical protein GCM10009715_44020 [Paeniglutamicibacter psychrophenolicus]|uniref:Uncharacterized protein n=1 Tax=Paeniglutamicibacter psychrophenolicus TaxID=257454 RepID=A0ABS4WGC8_9MICC|nr:hypothetical protein [Paeniglutamicibacter psychrophenolicus]